MEEKEMVRRIKNSFKAGRSRSDVIRTLQSKGYRLEYANALIKKAKPHGRWFYASLSIISILVVLVLLASYLLFFQEGEKQSLKNPLDGISVLFADNSASPIGNITGEPVQEVSIGDIEITPAFLSYLLNEIGAWKLHSNPLNFEKPKINFKIGEEYFNSIIDKEITTFVGPSDSADLQFNTNKEDLVNALLSESPSEIFRESVIEGRTEIQRLAGEAELFAKGYLELYNSLK